MKFKTAFIYSPFFLKHDTGHHPESFRRLEVIVKELKNKGIYEKLLQINPKKASEEIVYLVHDPNYAYELKAKCIQKDSFLDMDTAISPESYDVALTAVGGITEAVDAVIKCDVKNAFCAVRPPGHHATSARGMGFCLFNNVAIGARYAQKKYNLKNILIVDWDAHHGNGTQEIFYNDPSVFYFSMHQFPYYPGTGRKEETGIDKGRGYTLNIPVSSSISEEEFLEKFYNGVLESIKHFNPDMIFISAGFDSHKDDFLASLPITEDGYVKMTKFVMDIAEKKCSGKIISVLEGGYNLKALANSVCSHIEALMG